MHKNDCTAEVDFVFGGQRRHTRTGESYRTGFPRARAPAVAIAALMIAVSAPTPAAWPERPLRVVVGSSAGGGGDILARTISPKLSDALGQPIVIDNRGGAAGAIACEIVAKAAPDGYTVLLASVGMLAINPGLYPKLQYAPLRDFRPLTLLAAAPYVLVVNPSVPARSVRELIALAAAKPGSLNFASGGTGTGNHFSGELFKLLAGIDLVHVPYKGTGPALTDVLGGQIQIMFSNLLPAMPHVRAGRLRALAVTSAQRSPSAPELPSVGESLAGYSTTVWHGLLLPVQTPPAIATRLQREVVTLLQQPEIRGRLALQGTDTVGNSPEEFSAVIRDEMQKWAKVITRAGVKPD